jgi:hypothetical protein
MRHWYATNESTLRRLWNWAMGIIAIGCLIGGLVYAPFSPIPNGFNNYSTKIVAFGSVDFPVQLVYQRVNETMIIVGCPHTAELTFTLSVGPIVSDRLLDIQIVMRACPVFASDVNIVWVTMENAQDGSSSSSPAKVVMDYNQNAGSWLGSHKITYLVSGTFTATLVFYLRNGTELPYPTGTIIPVESPETIVASQNEALTTSLSFLVLMFAAIEVRVDSRKKDADCTHQNGTVNNQSREKVKNSI